MSRMLLMLGALLLAFPGSGQTPGQTQETRPEKPPEHVRRSVELKHLAGNRADRAAVLISRFMHPAGSITIDPELKMAVLQGAPEVVDGAEALLKKFDVPAGDSATSQVQFTIHLIEASPEEGRGSAVPKDIASAVEQMKRTFQYKSYRYMDSILLVGRGNGSTGLSGLLPNEATRSSLPTRYEVSYDTATVLENAKTVFLKNFRLNLRVPTQPGNFTDVGLKTDLSVREGQKMVIGKLSADQSANAIFLILTAEVQ